MGKYRKKPVIVDAIQWCGWESDYEAICKMCDRKILFNSNGNTLTIETLEGDHLANEEDYIIKGVKGECYPCKPDIFEMTYEKVED